MIKTKNSKKFNKNAEEVKKFFQRSHPNGQKEHEKKIKHH